MNRRKIYIARTAIKPTLPITQGLVLFLIMDKTHWIPNPFFIVIWTIIWVYYTLLFIGCLSIIIRYEGIDPFNIIPKEGKPKKSPTFKEKMAEYMKSEG